MNDITSEVLQFVKENDVKFIRLAFCDLFGRQKNIAIMANELERAFTHGISFDASAIPGFGSVENSELFLVPEGSTVSILPWRPEHERVMRMFCQIRKPDGMEFEGDSRYLLKQAMNRCVDMGYLCRVGTECEFYLFQTDEKGNPTYKPFDNGGYGDVAPLDKGEDIRREICLALEEMDLMPERSHHERGAGQNEVDFRYADALSAADNFVTFKWVVKSIAARNGLFASFLPKPLLNDSGNGMHINLSLSKEGKNLFQSGDTHCESAESFVAGILERAAEITAFLNPIPNSYRRLGAFEAPRYVTWSRGNRSQLVRIPAAYGEYNRMELRSPDPSCNAYLAFALLLHAGLDGMERKISLGQPCNRNLYESDQEKNVASLPASLEEAIILAEKSEFIKSVLPETVRKKYMEQKRQECEFLSQVEKPYSLEMATYFPVI